MPGKLDRYIARFFASSYIVALLFLVGLFLITDGVSKVEDMIKSSEKLAEENAGIAFAPLVVKYFLVQFPLVFLTMGPFITLFAGIFTVVRLQRCNELAPILCAGRSLQRIMLPVLVGGGLAALAMFALREFLLPSLASERDRIAAVILERQTSYQIEDFYFRDAPDVFVNFDSYDPSTQRICGLMVSRVLPDGRELRLRAAVATWEQLEERRGLWHLEHYVQDEKGQMQLVSGSDVENEYADAETSTVEAPAFIGGARSELEREFWRVRFRPGDLIILKRLSASPMELSSSEVRRLQSFYPDDHRLETLALYAISFPAANLVLLLLGLPFCLHLERRNMAEGLAKALLLCVLYFCADFVLRDLGTRHVIQAAVACFLPLVLFGSLGLARFLSVRT